MGTRSRTHLVDEKGTRVMSLYRQFDGYPSGHGKELAEFLAPFVIVNGYRPSDTRIIANGAGCLGAQMISFFKKGVGGFYLTPPNVELGWEDYEYEVRVPEAGGQIEMICWEVNYDSNRQSGVRGALKYKGSPQGFLAWLAAAGDTRDAA